MLLQLKHNYLKDQLVCYHLYFKIYQWPLEDQKYIEIKDLDPLCPGLPY